MNMLKGLALKTYQLHSEAIDLVLLDVRMPGLDGPQTLAALQQINRVQLIPQHCCQAASFKVNG